MAGLNELIAKLQRLERGEVFQRMGASIANVCHAQAIAGFRAQSDPYGTPWAPRTNPRGTWPLLQKTGAGIDSLTARYVAGTVVMRIKGYFTFHQHGTMRMVARKVFPEQARGLGTWAEPIQRAATQAVRELMR